MLEYFFVETLVGILLSEKNSVPCDFLLRLLQTTLLDFELVLRLVQRFFNLDEVPKNETSLLKVARMIDAYLAEAYLDSNLPLLEFISLAGSLPNHARIADDGFTEPSIPTSKKTLCRLMDNQKLSPEASYHATQNERLHVRAVTLISPPAPAKRLCRVADVLLVWFGIGFNMWKHRRLMHRSMVLLVKRM
ncbi:hypothetical protein MKX03_007006 [Papaver bracteatum]|nr:hypothetical protein MKX03_007006 [Papaver bracteatum]